MISLLTSWKVLQFSFSPNNWPTIIIFTIFFSHLKTYTNNITTPLNTNSMHLINLFLQTTFENEFLALKILLRKLVLSYNFQCSFLVIFVTFSKCAYVISYNDNRQYFANIFVEKNIRNINMKKYKKNKSKWFIWPCYKHKA